LDETFERPKNFDLQRHWADAVSGFEAGLRTRRARLRAAPSALDRIDRLGADMAEPLRAAAPGTGGWREAEVPIESIAHAAGLLLGFADEIEVLEPAELRQELADRAARVASLYAGLHREQVQDERKGS
jgi:predicted DNA-binding transcriptional regulator YafY